MKINVEEKSGVSILKLVGRLTLEQIAILDQSVSDILFRGSRGIVLNMIGVTDISSSGLAKILQASRMTEAKRAGFALCELSPVCEYVLDLARLADAFSVYKTENEAVEAIIHAGPAA